MTRMPDPRALTRMGLLMALTATACGCGGTQPSRLARIRQRGELVCGIKAGIAGFARADASGRYRGMDVDICRAVAAAILGDADRVRFMPATTVDEMLPSEMDLASRRLTWSLQREGRGVLFGPVTFYDGQTFMVMAAAPIARAEQLADRRICVYEGSEHDVNVTSHFKRQRLTFQRVPVADGAGALRALRAGDCDAFTTDLTELASLRSELPARNDVRILADRISHEPLAQLVRASDVDLFNVLRWTVFALITAEELNVTSENADAMKASDDPDVRRLLGVTEGNGAALGLDEAWAERIVRAVGNYGEIFARNVGPETPVGLERGLSDLWTRGGLLIAPPLR
jgi:general L-amino acid transport system substrate-binding protein